MQCNVRLPKLLVALIQKDAAQFEKPTQSVVQKALERFYSLETKERGRILVLAETHGQTKKMIRRFTQEAHKV